jgi:hydroxymethylbilane synthase
LIRIGTRGSALALAQANWVAARLGEETELVTVTTRGDVGGLGDKSRWVSELERALLEDEIDVAVHSAKDVPAELADGLAVLAIPARADPGDVLCGADSLADVSSGARVGTSSLRRVAQLRAVRADLDVVPARGNVDTRLRKLNRGEFDALVLAAAGLERLGRRGEGGDVLDELVPAAGQGALLVEGRPDVLTADQLSELSDPDATACVLAERQVVHALGASCNTAVGAYATGSADGELEIVGWAGLPDGSEWISDRLRGAPAEVGRTLAERMASVGAVELLARAERKIGK